MNVRTLAGGKNVQKIGSIGPFADAKTTTSLSHFQLQYMFDQKSTKCTSGLCL